MGVLAQGALWRSVRGCLALPGAWRTAAARSNQHAGTHAHKQAHKWTFWLMEKDQSGFDYWQAAHRAEWADHVKVAHYRCGACTSVCGGHGGRPAWFTAGLPV